MRDSIARLLAYVRPEPLNIIHQHPEDSQLRIMLEGSLPSRDCYLPTLVVMFKIVTAKINGLANCVETHDLLVQFKDHPQMGFVVTNLHHPIGRQVISAEVDWPGGIVDVYSDLGTLQQWDSFPLWKKTIRPVGAIVSPLRKGCYKTIQSLLAPTRVALT